MQQNTHSESFIKKRRFYTFLPLIVLPFITLFYGVAVGKINKKSGQTVMTGQGLNTSLPDAIINQPKLINKLSYYEKAVEDSLRLAQQQQKDPYFQDTLTATAQTQNGSLAETSPKTASGKRQRFDDAKPDAVYRKLDALNAALGKASGPQLKAVEPREQIQDDSSQQQLHAQLERILENSQQDPDQGQEDQELNALSGMLDKIIQIQNPQLAAQNTDQTNVKGNVAAVTTSPAADSTSLFDPPNLSENLTATANGFYALDEPVSSAASTAIQAVIEKNPRLVSGSTVKLRLTSDIFIQGELVPKGTFLFGQASLSGERLNIQIQSVRHRNALFQVNLTAYDMDGQPGIYIPGAISRDVAKQSAAQTATGISIGSLDNSLGAQAVDATIQATRTLLSRKAKLQQVSIPQGYNVLLYDKNGPGIITR